MMDDHAYMVGLTDPEVHPKGWGEEIWIANNDKYCGKLLKFEKGKKCSMHYHMIKDETWYVLSGRIKMSTIDTRIARVTDVEVGEGKVIHIRHGQPHRVTALEDTTIVEVSTQHFEDDSYRVEAGDSQ
jgi:mannose-6-phosphate isomerase-like protein (cupin superfamily)